MSSLLQLTPEDKDQLIELLNIGVAHAGTTLSQMLARRITISVPRASLKNTETASYVMGNADEVTLAVLLRITGGLEGYVFILFPHDAATRLLRALSGKTVGDLRALDAYDRSVFQEIANMLTGGMLQGFTQFLHCSLIHSVPDVVVDMSGAMFNSLSATMIARHDEFFSLDVTLCIDPPKDAIDCHPGEEATGHIFLFLGPDAVQEILALTKKITSSPTGVSKKTSQ